MTKREEVALKHILETSRTKCGVPLLHEPFMSNGFECVCDGYRIVKFYNHCLETDGREYDVSRFFKEFSEDYDCIQLPSIEELKNEVKENIGRSVVKKRLHYRIGNDSSYSVVNVRYLIDIMELLHTDKIYCRKDKKSIPLFLKSDIGEAVLLPIMDNTERVGFWVYNY